MNFEFDPAKSAANKKKHGIDFNAAQELWQDFDRLEFPGNSEVEFRNVLVATQNGKLWAAVFTMRGEKIRIISVRRARDEEKKIYEQTQKKDNGERA